MRIAANPKARSRPSFFITQQGLTVGKNDDRNADSIADLNRRLLMANIILVGSIAMVPLGFFCPCGIAMACAEAAPGVSTVLAILSLLLPFVGFGAMLLMGGIAPNTNPVWPSPRSPTHGGVGTRTHRRENSINSWVHFDCSPIRTTNSLVTS